jgi:hypothetical protein
VAAGLSRIGAANDRKTKTIAPPETLTNTAPQTHRLNVAYRSGSVSASRQARPAELRRGGEVPVNANAM